jgi:hypothetical protein
LRTEGISIRPDQAPMRAAARVAVSCGIVVERRITRAARRRR